MNQWIESSPPLQMRFYLFFENWTKSSKAHMTIKKVPKSQNSKGFYENLRWPEAKQKT